MDNVFSGILLLLGLLWLMYQLKNKFFPGVLTNDQSGSKPSSPEDNISERNRLGSLASAISSLDQDIKRVEVGLRRQTGSRDRSLRKRYIDLIELRTLAFDCYRMAEAKPGARVITVSGGVVDALELGLNCCSKAKVEAEVLLDKLSTS